MAGVDLGSIVAHLKLEMNDFNSKLNEAVARVKDTQTQFEGLKSFGQSLSSVGIGLTASITAPVMALGASVVKTQMQFEQAMSKVQALSGATGSDLQLLEDTAKQLGESTVYSASEAADALGYMALAGWDAQQSAAGLPGVLNLAAASGMDLAQASDLVTDYLTAFGLEADQAGRMADVLSYAQANSNTTTEMLGEAFKNCAVNAHNAGMTLEETTAILSKFADAGLKGLWTVLTGNPIVLIIAGIAALVAAFIYFWNTSESFRQFWINLWETIKTSAVNAWNAIGTFFTTTVPQWISNIGNWFAQLPSNIAYWLGYALGTVASWVVNLGTKGYQAGHDFVTKAVEFIKTLPAKIFTWLVQTIARVETWKIQMYQKAIQAGLQFIQGVIRFIQTLPSRVGTWLTSTISRVISFATQFAQKGIQAAQTFKNNIINGISSLPSRMVSIGSNIIHGIISGITGAASSLFSTMRNIASNALNAAKSALGIHSPSRVFANEVGQYIPEGVTLGIKTNARDSIEAIRKYANDLVAAINSNNFLRGMNIDTSAISITGNTASTDNQVLATVRGLYQLLSDKNFDINYDKMGEVYKKANAQTNTQIFMDKAKVGVAVASSVKERNDYLQNQQDRFRGDKDYV